MIKKIFIIVAVLLIFEGHVFAWFERNENAEDIIAIRAIKKILYIKDPRTNICFSYIAESGYAGAINPALATVDCKKIPPELLVVVKR